jgi:hypothetical protein
MGLIFRCRHYDENRHHDESEHNDGRVSPLVNKGEPLFANISNIFLYIIIALHAIIIYNAFKKTIYNTSSRFMPN